MYDLLITHPFAVAFGIIFGIQMLFFLFAAILKTDKVTDLAYGTTFAFMSVLFYVTFWDGFSWLKTLLMLMVVTWGTRLSGYLFMRIIKMGKDDRFDGIRENFINFLGFWSLQTLAIWVVMLPTLIFLQKDGSSLNASFISFIVYVFGLIIWETGFWIEFFADWQKFKFKNDKKNKGKFIQTGLWKHARHPNYFGEMLCWWGILFFTLPAFTGFDFIAILSPIFITFILMFVTGIPTLERKYAKKYKDSKEYKEYREKTPLLWPIWVWY